jgi:hypothetical protein
MQAVYIPEDDRCTDILGLVEDEDNLRYFNRFGFDQIFIHLYILVFVRIH